MNKGKQFEQRFKQNWNDTVSDSFCYRLFDTTSGYTGIANVSDFICYKKPHLFLIDCKSHSGNTVSFNDFSQYERMLDYKYITGVAAGTVIWFYDHEATVVWVPIETWEKIKLEGKKSFNIKMVDDPNYECLLLPSKQKRVFCDTNYSALIDYYNEVDNESNR